MDDISAETRIAIGALVERIDRLILKVRACAKASQGINKLRRAPAQSAAANAPNLANTGVPVGSRVAGWTVYNRAGEAIGWVNSVGGFMPGEPPISPPFARPAGEFRNAEDRERTDKLFEAAVNIRSFLGDHLRNALDSFPFDTRKEIRNLAIWRMAGGPVSLWVGAAEPHLEDLKKLLQRASRSETQADSQEVEGTEASSLKEPPVKESVAEQPSEAPVAAAPEPCEGIQFPKRAAWFDQKLLERGWTLFALKTAGGPDHRTVKKIRNGLAVRDDTLGRVARALSTHPDFPQVDVRDIPRN